jgi:DNA-binding response OmpR family regulator
MSANKILVVEDDSKILRILELQLKQVGYEVSLVMDGGQAETVFINDKFDLAILDVMLPGINGFELCRRIRERSQIPIIMLTAKTDVSDKVIGLDFGADDYLTKPFEMDELLARIRVQLRKNLNQENYQIINIEDLEINLNTYEVKRQGQTIVLSKTEFDLLSFLVKNRNIVLKREKILEEVWGYDFFGNDNVLDVYIKYLRDKIDKPYEKKLIKTVRGVGYVVR